MEVPYRTINKNTLRNMIEEFVSRDGTDYGESEVSLEDKINQVLQALRRGQAVIRYDEQSDMCEIKSVSWSDRES